MPADSELNANKATGTPKKYVWEALAQGSYNQVWRSSPNAVFSRPLIPNYHGSYVFKKPIVDEAETILPNLNATERAIRVWNDIHRGHEHAQAVVYKDGWVSPFFTAHRAVTDEEAAKVVCDVYAKTKRILLDAATEGNILAVNPHNESTNISDIVFEVVDVDLALKLRDGDYSEDAVQTFIDERMQAYFDDPVLKILKPKTLNVIQNLIYFDKALALNPKLIDFKPSLDLITALTWFRESNEPLVDEVLERLHEFIEIGMQPNASFVKTLYEDSVAKDEVTVMHKMAPAQDHDDSKDKTIIGEQAKNINRHHMFQMPSTPSYYRAPNPTQKESITNETLRTHQR